MHYRGRFAPSPSGPLHAGSLVAALGSFLDARANGGEWRLRIENIDPPREVAGAAATICRQLEAHELFWDGAIHWQHESEPHFDAVLNALIAQQDAYYCTCTRAEIKARGGHYDGYCRKRNRQPAQASVRFTNNAHVSQFSDRAAGTIQVPPEFAQEDFVLKRRDKLWAYQLAVVVDDYQQKISHVVRGADLLFPTVWQLSLWQSLQQLSKRSKLSFPLQQAPHYLHLPLQLDARGQKLSKQNHAPAIEAKHASANLFSALTKLGLSPPQELNGAKPAELLNFGIQQWPTKYR
ncbi:tRNA glutamyl-Q(34) synthetase GluQRS [Aliidiomarina celeris]|uniref:tRNA glutamyl-Q(34) synthetase GluQRS n=1 Tax=Aliidiomarina celeris TaxID=2249428 RepID=UPI000DEBC07D|nr:tRNA glutamyl-Q(34) synthetase GluQRS [Aliidiomarina celeris]